MDMTSLRTETAPGLVGCCAVVTLLAMGPLQGFDTATTRRWVLDHTPSWEPLVQHVLAPISGQAVCLPVLLLVGAVLARRLRSWRPLLVVLVTELAFYGGIGTIKVAFARPATILGDPRFFSGGVFEHGAHGI